MQDDGIGDAPQQEINIAEQPDVLAQERKGYVLGEIDLNPYSPSRKLAAQSMGMRYPYIGDDGIAAVESGSLYKGSQLDTIIVCWLCTLPDQSTKEQKWTPSRALRSPDAAVEAATKWAEGLGLLDTGSDLFMEAYKAFMGIVSNITAATFYAQQAESDAKDAPGK